MPIFRTAKLSMFREERAREFEDIAEKSMRFLSKDYPSNKCFGDIVREGGVAWEVLRQQNWFREKNPLRDTQGSLDFIAACIDEGISVKRIWNQVSFNDDTKFQGDLAERGLHGVHFRMNVESEADRIAYTCELANVILDNTYTKLRRISPINILSVLTKELKPAIRLFLEDPPSPDPGCGNLSHDQVVALTSLDYRGCMDEDDVAFFRQSVDSLLTHKFSPEVMTTKELVAAIEKAMIPLVYNFGYKLKAEGVDNHTVMSEAARRIDVLLSFVPLSLAFQGALRRQVLINLFSAFPEGLKMLQARPEELQGVMLNPVLIEDPLATLFSTTLAGPLALFSHGILLRQEYNAGKLIEFLTDAGYPIHLDTAIQGYLATEHEALYLAFSHPGWSTEIEERLQKKGSEGHIHRSLELYLFEPSRLCQYSDATVLKMIAQALHLQATAISNFRKSVPDRSSMTPPGYASIAPVLKEKPHLFEPVLEMLKQHDFLTQGMVEWCGFTHRELKALGKRAPNALKQIILESSLGL